ncbi:hypothetical protein F8388_014931 [Cannabis sativa]|uniref:CCHC-type domain-containing protein n=1 Tax=Cannabis sativa TaxID=3483 RepID=A0A7J6F675_CANSA|nr:hypothetical protein F8388_014931 [Cannabis sativa]KAF4404956.1 hypothetical protein G4B88_006342 [Cannabis sativa]
MPHTPEITMDDLLDRTGNLRMEDEAGWEVNEEKEAEVGKSCLMGRLCSNKSMNRTLIRTILGRIWGLAEVDWGVKIKHTTTEASFLIFSFKRGEDLTRILTKSPWMLNNGVLILQRFTKTPSKWEEELNRFPLKGRVLNLPTKSITRNNMLRLASMAGEVIEIQQEDATKITLNGFFWFKAWISLDKPLCPGFLFPMSGGRIWLPFRYERLPFMCFSCGYVGHDFKTCAKHPEQITDGNGKTKAAYGPWLKVDDKLTVNKGKKQSEETPGSGIIETRYGKEDKVDEHQVKMTKAYGDEPSKAKKGQTNEETQGSDPVQRITNKNSLHLEVPKTNPSFSCNFVNLMKSFEVPRVEKDFENEGGVGNKRRAVCWEHRIWGEGPANDTGKRIHRENPEGQKDEGLNLSKGGSGWVDIPIKFNKDLGSETHKPAEDRPKRVANRRTKKVDPTIAQPSISNRGGKVRINEDKWLPRGAPFLLRTPAMVPPNTLVNTLMNGNGEWNTEYIKEKMHEDDIPWIMGIQTNQGYGEDNLLWHYTENGDYKMKQFWKAAGFWHLFPTGLSNMKDLTEFLIFMSKQCSVEDLETFLGLSWLVWNQRNQRIFQNKKTTLDSWTPWALDYITNTLHRNFEKKPATRTRNQNYWMPPKPGTFMLNCDAAVNHNDPEFALAAVIRDQGGLLIAAEVEYHTGMVSVKLAEILAIKLGLQLTRKMQTKPFTAASDNVSAINQIKLLASSSLRTCITFPGQTYQIDEAQFGRTSQIGIKPTGTDYPEPLP